MVPVVVEQVVVTKSSITFVALMWRRYSTFINNNY